MFKLFPERCGRYSWTVRRVGTGTDRSDLHIIRVAEPPGFEGDFLTPIGKGGELRKRYKRDGSQVFGYRAEAREEKKRIGWQSNRNSWRLQSDGSGVPWN